MRTALLAICLTGCALHADVVGTLPAGSECLAPPTLGLQASFGGHIGAPRHRGIDVIAREDDDVQTVAGKIAYSRFDFEGRDEPVALFACLDGSWSRLGTPRTGPDGRFELQLTGRERLPAGMHDLYGLVPTDGTGFRFLAYIARPDERVVVSDVDGTLTEGEHAIANTVLFGDDIAHRPRAPQALSALGYTIVYVTARGDQYTDVTRRWLAAHGFPRGPLRLARASLLAPGPRQQRWKTETLRALHVPIAAAIGNRFTDIAAYVGSGLAPAQILIKLPEFADEVRPAIEAHRAVGFRDFRELPALIR